MDPAAVRRLPLLMLIALFAVLTLRTAWTADDAYITYRTVENFVQGRGLTWNEGERVQAYTHPLWMLLLSAGRAATGEIERTALAISFVLSVLTVLVFTFGVAAGTTQALLGLLILIFSKSYVDYATSGLENPLTHLLLALFALRWLRPTPPAAGTFTLFLLGGLLALTRLDCLLIVLPPLALHLWQHRSRSTFALATAGLLPLLAWEIFSIVYYGVPFPNTAYAKLNTGIRSATLLSHGLFYYVSTVNLDPVLMLVLLAALLAPLAVRDAPRIALVLGIALYMAYVAVIGGDFMAGRMLTGCLLTAVCVLGSLPNLPAADAAIAAAAVLLMGLLNPRAAIYSQDTFGHGLRFIDRRGVTDERAFYYEATGLLRRRPFQRRPNHRWVEQALTVRAEGRRVVLKGNIGMFGFFAGRDVYVVDPFALADPLLARLPVDPSDEWGIGHYRRTIPLGYLETLEHGQNQIEDAPIARLYDRIRLITRGSLWSAQRWRAIIDLHFGRLDALLDGYLARGLWQRSVPLEYGLWRPGQE